MPCLTPRHLPPSSPQRELGYFVSALTKRGIRSFHGVTYLASRSSFLFLIGRFTGRELLVGSTANQPARMALCCSAHN